MDANTARQKKKREKGKKIRFLYCIYLSLTKKMERVINEWTTFYTSSVFVLGINRREYIIRRKEIMSCEIKEDNMVVEPKVK